MPKITKARLNASSRKNTNITQGGLEQTTGSMLTPEGHRKPTDDKGLPPEEARTSKCPLRQHMAQDGKHC